MSLSNKHKISKLKKSMFIIGTFLVSFLGVFFIFSLQALSKGLFRDILALIGFLIVAVPLVILFFIFMDGPDYYFNDSKRNFYTQSVSGVTIDQTNYVHHIKQYKGTSFRLFSNTSISSFIHFKHTTVLLDFIDFIQQSSTVSQEFAKIKILQESDQFKKSKQEFIQETLDSLLTPIFITALVEYIQSVKGTENESFVLNSIYFKSNDLNPTDKIPVTFFKSGEYSYSFISVNEPFMLAFLEKDFMNVYKEERRKIISALNLFYIDNFEVKSEKNKPKTFTKESEINEFLANLSV